MKKIIFFALFVGCGPLSADMTINWGANQKITKTLSVDQTQTDTQSNNQASVWEDFIKILPFLTPAPTPIPTPLPVVKSVTIELEPKPTTPVIVYETAPAPTPLVRRYKKPCPK